MEHFSRIFAGHYHDKLVLRNINLGKDFEDKNVKKWEKIIKN